MILSIKKLLQNTQLQDQVKEANNLIEAIELITIFGTEKGYSFTQDSVVQMFNRLTLEEQELSEADLLTVTGGLQPISGGLCKTINSGTRC